MANLDRWKQAQQHEIAFWKYTRQHGYGTLSWDQLIEKNGTEVLSLLSKIKPLPLFRDDIVIDLGCGPLGLSWYLDCKYAIGVDPLLAVYRNEFPHFDNKRTNLLWIAARGEEVPLPDGVADVVYSRNVLDHVHQPEPWMNEFVRLLRPGGQFLLYVNLAEGWHKEGEDAVMHPHDFTEETMLKLLRAFPLTFDYYVDRPAGVTKPDKEVPIVVVGTRMKDGRAI
jgi:SAM-dependent methyltransferase